MFLCPDIFRAGRPQTDGTGDSAAHDSGRATPIRRSDEVDWTAPAGDPTREKALVSAQVTRQTAGGVLLR
jgi:hypothetical protein